VGEDDVYGERRICKNAGETEIEGESVFAAGELRPIIPVK
jgi:hypothetical protein